MTRLQKEFEEPEIVKRLSLQSTDYRWADVDTRIRITNGKAEISQIPLRLAWAITVHKSQGMSLDAAQIDLSKSFVPGMGYVVLSRVRALKGMKLIGINDMALKVNQEVFEIDKELKKRSEVDAQIIKGQTH